SASRRRDSTVVWSRKSVRIGLYRLTARSPSNSTVEMWVSATAAGPLTVRSRPVPTRSAAVLPLAALGEAGGVDGGLGAPAHSELREQVADVVLDRLLGEEHPLTDLAVGEALRDEIEDLALLG